MGGLCNGGASGNKNKNSSKGNKVNELPAHEKALMDCKQTRDKIKKEIDTEEFWDERVARCFVSSQMRVAASASASCIRISYSAAKLSGSLRACWGESSLGSAPHPSHKGTLE